ncbi:MAG: AMIN domain-containing protein [Candidatus Aminicenantes bacterium]|nr:AMIN domain-containing protein [Candidatus Aminicenantes bacterium]
MTRKNLSLFPFLLLFIFLLATFSFSQQKGNMEKIVVSKTEKTLEVRVLLSFFSYYRQFELTRPNRVVIDCFDIRAIKAPRFLRINALGVRGIRTGKFRANIARVVFDMLDGIPPYKVETIDNGLRILFWSEEEKVIEEKVIEEKPEIGVEDAICDMNVTPVRANLNDPILLDMSGSKNAKSMEVEVFDKEGIRIESQTLTPENPKWETRFDQPGEYFFKGKAFSKEDKPSENLCEAKTYINAPPVTRLEAKPRRAQIQKPINLDATDSTDPDGEVLRIDFEITDEEGNIIDRFTDNEKPFSWEKIFEDIGVYTIAAIGMDDFGAVSEPALVKVVAREGKKRLFFVMDEGVLAARGQDTYIVFAAGRLGIAYEILPGTLDIIIRGGAAYTNASAPWKSFFNGSLTLSFHIGPFSIGAGAGVATRDIETLPKSYGEAVANIGINLFNLSKTKISILFEAAGPVSNLSFEDHHKLMASFRLKF